jgi:quinolinate synthase
VAYVNTSAEVKAYCDICCTSSNALKIVESLEADKILFVPDRNLGTYIARQLPEKEILLWDGFCITHERIEEEEVLEARAKYPEADILMHPECNPAIWQYADYMGSTSQIIDYAVHSDKQTFIIGTEVGIMHSLKKRAPGKTFHLLSPCLVCQNMKKTTLEDVEKALSGETAEIILDEALRARAELSLIRMLNANA